jgi:hypothetical protein
VALGRLSVAASLFTACVVGCETRDVYLVPFGSPLHVDAGHHGSGGASPSLDAGRRPHDSGVMFPPDSGRPACETSRYPEVPQALGVYVMVDQSSTMNPVWGAVSDALSQFIQQSGTLGEVSVGIKYYALSPGELEPGQIYQDVVCLSDSYRIPSVAIGLLPNNGAALITSIANHRPSDLSAFLRSIFLNFDIVPTDAALTGAIAGAREWVTGNATSHAKSVVLLVTTGVPTVSALCQPSLEAAKLAAANGFQQAPSVPTYVLDVGAPNADLDAIAQEGGTDHAYSAANNADMLTALQSIRELALPCEIDVSAHTASLDRLNVELSTDQGSTRFSRLGAGQTACDASRVDQWYLEEADTSATVRLCPNTCVNARSVQSLSPATLDVVLGCRTTVD